MLIKDLSFSSNLFLSPLAGYSDAAFRRITGECGAAAGVTEMVSAEALARGNEKTELIAKRYKPDEKLIIQLFGPALSPFERSLDTVMKLNPDMIDINCGCPVPKVVKTGAGSALMKNPEEKGRIVAFLSKETKHPVSVKFRLGWDSTQINYLEFAKEAVASGASMLTLHARTRSQGYSGKADWSAIKKLKEEFKDTVIFGSGDIFSPEDVKSFFETTRADGVMIARGAIGNPFIFRQSLDLLQNGTYEPATTTEMKETLLRHFDYLRAFEGGRIAVKEMRKHACAYLKGVPGASKVKDLIVRAQSREEYIEALDLIS